MLTTRSRGKSAEDAAASYLTKQGLRLVDSNYYCRQGEIDLIMQDNTTLVFVEVRYRRNTQFGTPQSTVDSRKCRKIILAANHYLQKNRLDMRCRFDVIAITGTNNRIQWIKSAFDVV